VERLILTHVPPWVSPQLQATEAAVAFDGPIELARAGAEFVI
jgi:ribonuclease BN (tRNA processing enzyme)